MAKFFGVLGIVAGYETINGISTPNIKEIPIGGDLLSNSYRNDSSEKINDDLSMTNRFSFIAPQELISVFSECQCNDIVTSMYIKYMGIKMKVKEFNFQMPRVIMTVGGIYNE